MHCDNRYNDSKLMDIGDVSLCHNKSYVKLPTIFINGNKLFELHCNRDMSLARSNNVHK